MSQNTSDWATTPLLRDSPASPALASKSSLCKLCLVWNTEKSQLKLARLHKAEIEKLIKWNFWNTWGNLKTSSFPSVPLKHYIEKIQKRKSRGKENCSECVNQLKRSKNKEEENTFLYRYLMSVALAETRDGGTTVLRLNAVIQLSVGKRAQIWPLQTFFLLLYSRLAVMVFVLRFTKREIKSYQKTCKDT